MIAAFKGDIQLQKFNANDLEFEDDLAIVVNSIANSSDLEVEDVEEENFEQLKMLYLKSHPCKERALED